MSADPRLGSGFADWCTGQVIVTVLACWFASGIVFGFAALKPVLIDQGVYRELCTKEELAANVEVCYEQDLRLNFFFAVASTTCNISALPVGTILDRYGPRVSVMLGCVCLAIGSLLMAYAFKIPDFDGYIAGNVWLALGGTFIFVPSFSIANAFPKFSGLIVAMVTGAFDASAAVFLFYRLAYESSKSVFTPERFFFGYLIVPAVILVAQITLMTADGYKTVSELEQKIEKQEDVTADVRIVAISRRTIIADISSRCMTRTKILATAKSRDCAPSGRSTANRNCVNSTMSSVMPSSDRRESSARGTARQPVAFGAPCTANRRRSKCCLPGSSSSRS